MTKLILAILDPIAFPKPKKGLPCRAEIMETKISGIDVANPTITMPINKFDNPKKLPRLSAYKINLLADWKTNMNPRINKNTSI